MSDEVRIENEALLRDARFMNAAVPRQTLEQRIRHLESQMVAAFARIEMLEGEHFGTPPKTYADAAFDAYEAQFTGPAGSNPAPSADEQLSADISAAFTNYTFKR